MIDQDTHAQSLDWAKNSFSDVQNMIDSKLLEAEDEAANTLIRFSSTEILDDVYKILKSTNL